VLFRCACAVVTLVGCGRIGFDARAVALDAAADGSAPVDARDESLRVHLAFDSDGLLVDRANAHGVTCTTACPTSTASRIGDGAALFSNLPCLEIAASADLQPTQVTLTAWARFQAPMAPNQVVGRPFLGDTQSGNTLEMWAAVTPVWAAAGNGMGVVGMPFLDDTWQHLAAAHDGTSLRL
jgi:hypothetical protein